ncbi:MAG: hypothetical protein RIQ79_324 [Verrucomicrobiota bacterium]
MDINTVEQRTADAGAVTLNLGGRATALVASVAQITAGAGVHRGDEHEGAGQGDFAGAARDGDGSILEGLTKNLKGGAFELGQLVEEQHAVVGQGNLAGAGDGAAADETDIGDSVVGGAHGAASEVVRVSQRLACGGVDGEDLQ